MPLWYNVCDWPLRSGQLAFWFTVPELKPHLWKMCNVKNGWNESIQKYDTEFTVLKYIVCAVKIFCHVWCCSAHEDIICMATALFYGFDETTTVNLGHKITLYSQPNITLIEEMSDKCLTDSLYDCLHWDNAEAQCARAQPLKTCLIQPNKYVNHLLL